MTEQNLSDMIEAGRGLHRSGRLEEAEALYRRVLTEDPRHGQAQHLLGVLALQRGQIAEAVERLDMAVEAEPDDPNIRNNLGNAYRAAGRMEDAIRAYAAALVHRPDFPDAHYNLGMAHQAAGRNEEATACFRRTIALDPGMVPAHVNLAIALTRQNMVVEAVAAFEEALRLVPGHRQVHAMLLDLHLSRGIAATEAARFPEAAECYGAALALDPDNALALVNRGCAHFFTRQLAESIADLEKAATIVPDLVDAHVFLGRSYRAAGQLESAIRCQKRALALQPQAPDPHLELGNALLASGRRTEAMACYRTVLSLRPESVEAYTNIGNLQVEQGLLDEAAATYAEAVALNPAGPSDMLYQLRKQLCRWDVADEARFREQLRDPARRIYPFVALGSSATAAEQLDGVTRWVAGLEIPAEQRFHHDRPLSPGAASPGERIRIGYMSSDFYEHAVSYLVVGLLERHDRSRFEVFAYSIGAENSGPMRRRIMAAVDHFVDLSPYPHREAARRIHDDRIHILIDLNGYTTQGRPEILSYRPAPVQVNYLGYPGTMGADFMDYIIVDPVVAPPEDQRFFSERLVHLPHCYQPNDPGRVIAEQTPSRASLGLPEQGFVFCCFNNLYKITPEVFAVWMRLLANLPGAVLWLLDDGTSATTALAREAEKSGIDAARLVFAPRCPQAEHLARHRRADLFLDTLPYNAHTTASDALWAGLPVLTCRGETFAGRVAASLLHAVGLPELVTHGREEYERMAMELAGNRAMLDSLRSRLADNRGNSPLFDIDLYRRHMEEILIGMWSNIGVT